MVDVLAGIFFLCLGGGVAIAGIVLGEIPGKPVSTSRSERPVSFWFEIALFSFGGLLGLYFIGRGLGLLP